MSMSDGFQYLQGAMNDNQFPKGSGLAEMVGLESYLLNHLAEHYEGTGDPIEIVTG